MLSYSSGKFAAKGFAALLVLATVAMPLNAGADEAKKPERAEAPAAAAPARAAPARVAAPRISAPRAAPHINAQRAAPHFTPQRAAVPHNIQRAATPSRVQHVAQPTAHVNSQATVNRPAAAVQTRQAQRQEHTLRLRENRALRATPAPQRAAKRQEIQRARVQRAQGVATPNARTTLQAQPNAAVQNNAQLRGPRRNGQPRVTVQAAQQGRFAAPFAANANAPSGRWSHYAAGQAWQHGERAGFVPWYGPVFWPYAYSDIFDYAFWPGGYDDGYFAYAYDDFFDGVFWGEEGPPPVYVDSGPVGHSAPQASYASVQELCKQPGNGVTAWPTAEIQSKVGLNADQKQLLVDVKDAGAKAAAGFKASCPSENAFPLTPPGRLVAMTTRLGATLSAVETVKPALDKFYNSLSDEQKERFNQIGPKPAKTASIPAETTGSATATADNSCKQQKPGLTNLPMEKIEDAVKPTDAQEAQLKDLEDATGNAVSILQAACPDQTPLTPPGRLDAMETRLKAMIEAANTVKPALSSFYASLSNEQKARFDRIGGALAQAN
jgi:hypothetical protein